MNALAYIGIFFGTCFAAVMVGAVHVWIGEYRETRKERRERELQQAREDMEDMLRGDSYV